MDIHETTDTNARDKDGYPTNGAKHLREAFAVVGALVGAGDLHVDLSVDKDGAGWWNMYDAWVSTVAAALDVVDPD
jgi:hypothetical protein